ncbi:bifunctional enzyme CysN/CysC, partial [Pelagibacterium halotolerans]
PERADITLNGATKTPEQMTDEIYEMIGA